MAEIDYFENEIILEANQQAKEIVQNAKEEATKILNQARSESERIAQKILVEIEKEEEQKAQRELSRLRIISKIEINNVKEMLLKQILANSLKRIQEWKDKKSEEYCSALIDLIVQGGVSLEGGELTVKLTPEDVSLIDIKDIQSKIMKASGNKTSLKVTTTESDLDEGGAIICKESLSVFNTIEARLSRREDFIRDKVHAILFTD
ncbi:MAG: V-type ATP synthase subunit E [Promethearchaeota archaeon]